MSTFCAEPAAAAMIALALHDRDFHAISALMHEAVGLSFPSTKKPLVHARLSPRIRKLGLPTFADYIALLQDVQQAGEFQMAVDLLTTNETYFFREPRHFDLLQQEAQALGPARNLAVWSAAASFGDEAYSVAMLLAELQMRAQTGPGWSVVATDISQRVLQCAQAGIYPQDRLRDVSPERLKRHCLRGEGPAQGQVMVREHLRERVQFGQLNLCRRFEGLGPFDAVFLRNVLIYFDAPTKSAVVERVLATLKPGGLLFLGTAEGRVPCATPLAAVSPGVFRKPR
ncbi:MAG: CheR family methyltransferase [Rhodoferax sp.]